MYEPSPELQEARLEYESRPAGQVCSDCQFEARNGHSPECWWVETPETLKVSQTAYNQIVELIENPPPPSPALRRLMKLPVL